MARSTCYCRNASLASRRRNKQVGPGDAARPSIVLEPHAKDAKDAAQINRSHGVLCVLGVRPFGPEHQNSRALPHLDFQDKLDTVTALPLQTPYFQPSDARAFSIKP